jgi:hypothetical protein
MTNRIKYLLLGGALCLGGATAPQPLAAEDGSMFLQTLERGMWQLRTVGSGASGAAASQLCLGDPRLLAQIQHGAAACSQLVVDQDSNSVTISYTCRGAGQGLTTIRKETDRLVQIKSQGIHNNSPFSFAVEGRRTGGC